MTIGKKMICCSEKSGEDKLLSGSLGPCPCLFCIVILTSLCHQQGETGQTITIKYNKCHQMSSSASAHQSWVTTHWPIWSLSYRHRSKIFVTKLLKFFFWQRGTWSAFLIRLVTRQKIAIRPEDSKRASPDTTQVFVSSGLWMMKLTHLVTMKSWWPVWRELLVSS